ncbi:hypothetical protein [Alkalilimnicola ehrlichii]|nr:hypothetical protein [Alkalilimnicola ehrlichii]
MTDKQIEAVARAIALNGFGRPWDDFPERSMRETCQEDLMEYAETAIAALRESGGPFELPRYGIRWDGPKAPIAVPKTDGYWTPWHMAQESVATPQPDPDVLRRVREALHAIQRCDVSGGGVLAAQRAANEDLAELDAHERAHQPADSGTTGADARND